MANDPTLPVTATVGASSRARKQENSQNVRLDAALFVMPDWTHTKVGFLNPEGGLGFAELNVGLPQLFVGPVVDVAP